MTGSGSVGRIGAVSTLPQGARHQRQVPQPEDRGTRVAKGWLHAETYSAAGGLISRFFVGLTPGYYDPKITAEGIAEHLAEIDAEEGYLVGRHNGDEIKKIVDTLQG